LSVPNDLPTGTVTFLFSDIEGSTKLVERLGTSAWAQVLEAHRQIIRNSLAEAGGHEIKTEGDSFFIVFRSAEAAVGSAVGITRDLANQPWPPEADVRVRIGMHTGEGALSPTSDYVGLDVHRAARIAAAAHGGQILMSVTTAALVDHTLPTGASVRDRGEHRLKDLSRPERIVELVVDGLQSAFPPLRTLEATPNNLPTQLTTFLGREREIGQILELLGTSRLLTLTGPGGTGKTRLSLEVAARSTDRFPDGVFFVPLSAIDLPDLVAPTIAHAVGLPDRGGRAPIDRLLEHLGTRRILIVLDNFEQVLDAAPLVNSLLGGAPNLKVIVSSRAALHLYGEHEFPVPPLGMPDPGRLPDLAALSDYEAVNLFVERAMAVRPDFRLAAENAAAIVEICYRLDGLPLALELAAARVRLLSPQAMLARLQQVLDMPGSAQVRDLPARQQTLRGAIAWSHDLLDDQDRTLFACLSVFVGGADLDTIEAVCSTDDGFDVLDHLASLVDKSLLRQQEDRDGVPRFTMLETIREFARERLEEAGRTAQLRARHADLFCSLVDRARPLVMGPDKRRWLDRLEIEHGNIRAAFAWSIEQGDVARALRLSAGLWRFWQMRGYLAEGAERVAQALLLPAWENQPELRADALDAAGGLQYWQARHAEAERWYREALALRRSMGDMAGEAEQLYNISVVVAFGHPRGSPEAKESIELSEQALALFRTVGDRDGAGRALWGLASNEFSIERLQPARKHALEAMAIFEELQDGFMLAWSKYTLAGIQLTLHESLDEIIVRLEEALALFVEAADVSGYVLVLDAIAFVAQLQGDMERAARIFGGVIALEASSGTGLNAFNRTLMGFDPTPLREHPAWEEGNRMSIPELIDYALRRPATV
jgi:predicted ATPase/class 3 adenylate cyclase